MQDQTTGENRAIAMAWKNAWSRKRFRVITVTGTVVLLCILACFPIFFQHIEQREGVLLHDWLLLNIPSYDVSVPTFLIIWSMTILLWIRCVQDPYIFIVFLCCFIIASLTRMLTITLFPLNPPVGLIPLRDPLSSFFYGGPDIFIQKDLFYSGHTSTQLLIFFTLKKKSDKLLAFFASIAIGSFVLIQHVHYTIDVAAAVVFSYVIYLLCKKITGAEQMNR